MPGMTDRDHFAAAALTGLIHSQDLQAGPLRRELACTMAYRWADAMLRERERKNHDASPEATARTDADRGRTDKADARPGEGTGDTPATRATRGEGSEQRECTEPVAWAVEQPNGEFAVLAFNRQRAEDYATASERVVPLYRSPTLTDAEREAIRTAADAYAVRGSADGRESVNAATLRGLLERLGGEG